MTRTPFFLATSTIALFAGSLFLATSQGAVAPQEKKIAWAIVIHGGAGGAPSAARSEPIFASLKKYVKMGSDMLASGSSALDTVEKVMCAFEEDGQFNVGKGAVYTSEGKHSLDASLMDGSNLKFGGVAGVRIVKHPISLARAVMDKTKHVLLIREGAEEFAKKMNLEIVPNEYFDTPGRKKGFEQQQADRKAGIFIEEEGGSTAGCVCLDQKGNLAAGTSTGGLSGVMPGRVGDSPICGAGTYANNLTCAVSGTGTGEQYIRHNVAHTISALMQYKGLTAEKAAEELVFNTLKKGDGGVIVLSKTGEIAMPYNTAGMIRACADSTGRFEYGATKEMKKEPAK
jgi:beta-aspartyl-peptidase (threonine type)